MQPPDEKLVGTWVTEDEDSGVSFSIEIRDNAFQVSGICLYNGEAFAIENVMWDGMTLSFSAVMPSTGFRSHNAFRVRPDGKADFELTTYEIWKKLDA